MVSLVVCYNDGFQLSVMVSFQVAIGSAKLSIVDKDQGVTTKSARWVLIGILLPHVHDVILTC